MVVSDVPVPVAEPAGQLQRAERLASGPVAVWACQPVTHAVFPVPLQVGQATHLRFLNFCPFPVSHQPPLPSQAVQGFGSGGGSFGIVGPVLVMLPACAHVSLNVNTLALLRPRGSLSEKFREFDLEDTELIRPWIAHHPKVESSFLLMIPPRSAKCFKATALKYLDL